MADGNRRVNVNFSENAYRELNELAQRRGKTMSEVLRDAIELERWFDETRREGNRVLVERDGKVREIIPR
jgi:metal-responsive CopG/Arc/MetJ family transcriptional regulator